MKEEDDEKGHGNPALSPSSVLESDHEQDLLKIDKEEKQIDALEIAELRTSLNDKDETHELSKPRPVETRTEVVPRFRAKEQSNTNMDEPSLQSHQTASVAFLSREASSASSLQPTTNNHPATTPGAVRVNPGFRSADNSSSSSENDDDSTYDDVAPEEDLIEQVEGELDIEEDERIRREVLDNLEFARAEVVKDKEHKTLWRRQAILLFLAVIVVAIVVIVVVVVMMQDDGGGSSTTVQSSTIPSPIVPPPTASPSSAPSLRPSSSPTFLAWELSSTIRDDFHTDTAGFGLDVDIMTIHEGTELGRLTNKTTMLVITSPWNNSISTYFCDEKACDAGMFVEQKVLFNEEIIGERGLNVMVDLSRDGNTLAFAIESYHDYNLTTSSVGLIDLTPIFTTITRREPFTGNIDFFPIAESRAKSVKINEDGSLLSIIGNRLTICNLQNETFSCDQPHLDTLDSPLPENGVVPGVPQPDPERPFEIPIALAMDGAYVAMGTNIRDDWYDRTEDLQLEQSVEGLPRTDFDGFYEGFFVRVYDANGDQKGQTIKYEAESILSVKSLSLAVNGTLLSVGYARRSLNSVLVGIPFFPCFVSTYRLINETWIESSPTLLGNTPRRDYFGYSVALSREGDALAVGAPLAASEDDSNKEIGRAYSYKLSDDDWEITSSFTNGVEDSYFGRTLALTEDGDFLVISAPKLVNSPVYHYQYQSF